MVVKFHYVVTQKSVFGDEPRSSPCAVVQRHCHVSSAVLGLHSRCSDHTVVVVAAFYFCDCYKDGGCDVN